MVLPIRPLTRQINTVEISAGRKDVE